MNQAQFHHEVMAELEMKECAELYPEQKDMKEFVASNEENRSERL